MVVCDGIASESVVARYFDPKLGRFLTQDSYLGNHDNPPSLHRYTYALNRPTLFVDPTGHVAIIRGAADEWGQKREAVLSLTEELDHMDPMVGAKTFGIAISAGVAGVIEGGFRLLNVAANTTAAVFAGESEQQWATEARTEIAESFDLGEAVWQHRGEVAEHLATSAGQTLKAASEGDPRAAADVIAFGTEAALDVGFGVKGVKATARATTTAVRSSVRATTTVGSAARRGTRFGGRASRSGGEVLEGASWHRVRPGFDQPRTLSPLSRAARTVLRGHFERVGRSRSLPYRQRLTPGVRAQRTFATATRRHPPVEAAPVGWLLKNLPGLKRIKWEQGHVFGQQRWWRHNGPTQWFPDNRAANLGMRRRGNAGFNLAPMPRAMNRWLGRHPWASFGVGVGAAASVPGAFYGGYQLGEYVHDQVSGR